MQSLLNSGAPHAAIWAAERRGSVRGRVTSVPAAAGAACPVGGEAAASLLIPRRALRQPASRVSVFKKKKKICQRGLYKTWCNANSARWMRYKSLLSLKRTVRAKLTCCFYPLGHVLRTLVCKKQKTETKLMSYFRCQ